MALLSHCLLPDTRRSLQECLTIVLGAGFPCVCVCLYNGERDGQRQREVFSGSISIIVKDVDKAVARARVQAFCMSTETGRV